MIRILSLIAVIGFIVAVICLASAAALGGADVDHGWTMPNNWAFHVRDHHGDGPDIRFGPGRDEGPQASRPLTWDGSTRLELSVPGELHYTQAPGPAHITISGPRQVVDNVTIDHGRIRLIDPTHYARLTIEMSAPNVSVFSVTGSNDLDIEAYNQDQLTIDSSGSARINVQGQARAVRLSLSGSGDANLADLVTQAAQVDISGSADATIAPRDSANIHVSGSGEVTLTTRPATIHSDISGSGQVNQAEGGDEPPAIPPPATPTPPTPPAPANQAAPATK